MRQGRISGFISVSIAMIGVIALAMSGCDEGHHTTAIEKTPTTEPSRPTTQELISGKQQKIALRQIPFTLSVPAEWHIKQEAGLLMLEGATPSGVVQLQIGRHPAPIPQHAERLIEGAKRDAAAHPGEYTRAEVRESSNIRILETRSSGTTSNKAAIDAVGATVAPTSTPLNWKLSAFVPSGHDVDVCEIHFIDLTTEQYERDKELLDRVMASFEYDIKAESN